MIESLSRGTTTAKRIKKNQHIAVYKACLIIRVPFIKACVLSVSPFLLYRFRGATEPPLPGPQNLYLRRLYHLMMNQFI